ncbi:hypothetical protein BC830DRAFT_1082447 [Chytriomyces sp. MP71]|nr:hypothetical protein BC830DRAFT_1082447 [Chytriomyces sp. MP71]
MGLAVFIHGNKEGTCFRDSSNKTSYPDASVICGDLYVYILTIAFLGWSGGIVNGLAACETYEGDLCHPAEMFTKNMTRVAKLTLDTDDLYISLLTDRPEVFVLYNLRPAKGLMMAWVGVVVGKTCNWIREIESQAMVFAATGVDTTVELLDAPMGASRDDPYKERLYPTQTDLEDCAVQVKTDASRRAV